MEMNEWMQEKAVMEEGVDGSLVNAMLLEQLAGQCRRRGEWVLLGFVSWGHLLLISQSARRCSQMRTELWEDHSPREVCRALQPRGRWNCWDGYKDGLGSPQGVGGELLADWDLGVEVGGGKCLRRD